MSRMLHCQSTVHALLAGDVHGPCVLLLLLYNKSNSRYSRPYHQLSEIFSAESHMSRNAAHFVGTWLRLAKLAKHQRTQGSWVAKDQGRAEAPHSPPAGNHGPTWFYYYGLCMVVGVKTL
jgi:hypothetical protein